MLTTTTTTTTITTTTTTTTTAYCVHGTFLCACQKLAKLAHLKNLVFLHMTERLTANCLSHGMGLHTVLQYLLWIAKCVGFSDPDRAVFVPFKKVVMAWSI